MHDQFEGKITALKAKWLSYGTWIVFSCTKDYLNWKYISKGNVQDLR